MSTVRVRSPAYIVLHIPPILARIFIVHHVFICACLNMCVCDWESQCVDLRALQGCEARSSKRQKIPAAFGLVSASRKSGTMLHGRSPKVSPSRIVFIYFIL